MPAVFSTENQIKMYLYAQYQGVIHDQPELPLETANLPAPIQHNLTYRRITIGRKPLQHHIFAQNLFGILLMLHDMMQRMQKPITKQYIHYARNKTF